MKPILEIKEISKKFRIHHERKPYLSLRDGFTDFFKRKNNNDEDFWALKDVSFNVMPGDTIGIIGKNGAGKSTLLKILSKITPPTNGKIITRGRIASLLEVGTGFHPELTGRENIFLNGSILGMRKAEIQKNFDEIVAFSGVEQFLDTPLKQYSSGMQLRLAFAVAAFLENEILIIDEVLAVGDAEFQKKCMGKMEDISRNNGRTVLFVSHNLGVISQICSETIVLNKGSLLYRGKSQMAVDYYLDNCLTINDKIERSKDIAKNENQFLVIYNSDKNGREKSEYRHDEEIVLIVELYLPDWNPQLELAISLYDRHKRRIFTIHENLKKFYSDTPYMKFSIIIPSLFVTPGNYSWLMCINHHKQKIYDLQDDICRFSVIETGSDFAMHYGADYGCVFAKYDIKLMDSVGIE